MQAVKSDQYMYLLLQTTTRHDIGTASGFASFFDYLDSDRDGKLSFNDFMTHFQSREVVSPLYDTSLDGILYSTPAVLSARRGASTVVSSKHRQRFCL